MPSDSEWLAQAVRNGYEVTLLMVFCSAVSVTVTGLTANDRIKYKAQRRERLEMR